MPAVTISLSPQQASRVKQAVETGAYASDSEVVSEALELWERSHVFGSLDEAGIDRQLDIARGQVREGKSKVADDAFFEARREKIRAKFPAKSAR